MVVWTLSQQQKIEACVTRLSNQKSQVEREFYSWISETDTNSYYKNTVNSFRCTKHISYDENKFYDFYSLSIFWQMEKNVYWMAKIEFSFITKTIFGLDI